MQTEITVDDHVQLTEHIRLLISSRLGMAAAVVNVS